MILESENYILQSIHLDDIIENFATNEKARKQF